MPRHFYLLHSNGKKVGIGCTDTIFGFYIMCTSFCTMYISPGLAWNLLVPDEDERFEMSFLGIFNAIFLKEKECV